MPKGGARATSGPPPDPNALRRDRPSDAAEWVTLPSRREGPTPEWPLSEATSRESELWAEQWSRPQAFMWERNGQQIEVAMFVRALVDAERPGAVVAARTLVRQQMDSLGLSTPGLRSNRWKIAGDEVAARRTQAPRQSARDRLKVVDADGA